MIRLAQTMQDISSVIDLLQDFLTETSYSQGIEISQDREHLGKISAKVQRNGYIWFAPQQGLLMAIKEPNLWAPDLVSLRELVWYVRPEYRNSTVAGRLFREFLNEGDRLKQLGQIAATVTTAMTTTRTLDYSRWGFRLTEQTYIKE